MADDVLAEAERALGGTSKQAPRRRAKVLLGGADCQTGAASMLKKVVSESMACTKCGQHVLRFVGYKWASDVSYIHFREYYPDRTKLLAAATVSAKHAAYCCQCAWTHTDDIQAPTPSLPWVAVVA
mmetsp:Transcript_22324/g.68721  ORF Transcript_22324/g.68721 Transcript_22324/m.68721 type:complete len:126 (-) Transcript_22324:175-552(-)